MQNIETFDFGALLARSSQIHGHLCPGQVLGVRMSILGLTEIGIFDPTGRDRKSLIVFVEMDRCATDAVQSVTGCTLGRRTMKFFDYGKMAASFCNLRTGRAVRVVAREDSRERAKEYCQNITDKYAAQAAAYKIMSNEELFDVMEVSIDVRPEDMPGRPLRRVCCEECGEHVQDCREQTGADGKVLCRACASGAYYRQDGQTCDKPIYLGTAMHNSHNGMQMRSKLWIDIDGEPVFGKGRMQLLNAIGATGSITQAARAVNISYRRAWSYIKAMEKRLGIRLVECQAGGKSGGGASLTAEARSFLEKYEELDKGIRDIIDRRFSMVFEKGR
jgi:formylmethanofuran dehydrogenase subunit E